ncbi:hypothetical protein DTO166G4_358 [Paecilomyces variotii]|nr:hypothetical protein DTO166G4_358 [Paecilomyces variotii]KAJ9229681.1 hypothetical protein DTO166G5_7751 [Paecilomyces variotii]KAJ9291000.1 hypothetical protein DTO021C3_1216 [Paecilomyces variotii]KAJ9293616.1 hypothetical protein DTO217A2_9268 [Paecilomyces variotii]KAJ9370953.1 hypothetical protein DTO282E5_4250 [Paecilomyces variotii]
MKHWPYALLGLTPEASRASPDIQAGRRSICTEVRNSNFATLQVSTCSIVNLTLFTLRSFWILELDLQIDHRPYASPAKACPGVRQVELSAWPATVAAASQPRN